MLFSKIVTMTACPYTDLKIGIYNTIGLQSSDIWGLKSGLSACHADYKKIPWLQILNEISKLPFNIEKLTLKR